MINRLPRWFKQELPGQEVFNCLAILKELCLNTVCQSSRCPNLNQCFKSGKVTFMILGEYCTRHCRFCAVKKSNCQKLTLSIDEPEAVSRAVERLHLRYVILTSVTRDDLPDQGVGQFLRTLAALRQISARPKIELLIPDFSGSGRALEEIILLKPDIIAHNLETVERVYRELKPDSDYQRSLNVLKIIKKINGQMITKSSLILGLGERQSEVISAIEELIFAGVDILTLGQYLAPSPGHYPIQRFIHPEEFNDYRDIALAKGIKTVLAGPLVRSSFHAEELYQEVCACMI